ncbi:MAG: cell division protein FtsW, partial [Betaproteobacteria bacterium]
MSLHAPMTHAGWSQRLAAAWQSRPGWLGGAAVAREDAVRSVPIHDWVGRSGQPVRLQGFDQALVLVVLVLMALGLVMV